MNTKVETGGTAYPACNEANMSRVNDGGPAFPASNGVSTAGGMSLRDYFAGQVLAGFCSNFTGGNRDPDWFEQYGAASAWQIADAMIAAREVKP